MTVLDEFDADARRDRAEAIAERKAAAGRQTPQTVVAFTEAITPTRIVCELATPDLTKELYVWRRVFGWGVTDRGQVLPMVAATADDDLRPCLEPAGGYLTNGTIVTDADLEPCLNWNECRPSHNDADFCRGCGGDMNKERA